MARWPSSAALSCRCPWTIVPGPGPYPGVPGHSSCPWPLGSCSLPLPEKCPWLGWVGLRLQVVVEELFSKAEYYPILLLDFSQFLSYYLFNNWIKVQKIQNVRSKSEYPKIWTSFGVYMPNYCIQSLAVALLDGQSSLFGPLWKTSTY